MRNWQFTQREVEVLESLMLGQTNKEIAVVLGTAEGTIKVQVKSILRKLGVTTRTGAVIKVMAAALSVPCPNCGHVDDRP